MFRIQNHSEDVKTKSKSFKFLPGIIWKILFRSTWKQQPIRLCMNENETSTRSLNDRKNFANVQQWRTLKDFSYRIWTVWPHCSVSLGCHEGRSELCCFFHKFRSTLGIPGNSISQKRPNVCTNNSSQINFFRMNYLYFRKSI